MFSSIVLLGGTGDVGRRVVNLLNKTRIAGSIWSQGKAAFSSIHPLLPHMFRLLNPNHDRGQ